MPAPEPPPLDVGAHRLLGDGRGSALLTPDARVVWWCPRAPDDQPALASLLDPRGGHAAWLGTRLGSPLEADAGLPASDAMPAGPLLRTALHDGTGRLDCLDALIGEGDGPAQLVRFVRGLDADLDLTHELCPDEVLDPEGPQRPAQRHHLQAPPGEWRALLIDVDLQCREVAAEQWLATSLTSLDDVEAAIGRALLPRQHHERTVDALRVLHALTWHATGAVIAAPTTSVPEAIPGERQWDYRYSWLRDAGLSVSIASLLGLHATARSFLEFTCDVLDGDPLDAPPVVRVDGSEVPAERELPGVRGWAGIGPVRLGNDARAQVQHDALGLICEAISVHAQTGAGLDDEVWSVMRRTADGISDAVLEQRVEPSSGMWELREPALLVSEDIGRWVALDRALWIARGWHPLTRRRRWRRARAVLRARVLAALGPDGQLPMAYDDAGPAGPDAAALLIPVLGLERRSPAVHAMVDRITRELGSGVFTYRYPPGPDGEVAPDGLRGREGAFLPASFLLVSALAAIGRGREAQQHLDAMCERLPRLVPEMVDPTSGRSLGNTPLLWSHMELVRALYLLDHARRVRRFTLVGASLWRAGRYLRLRLRREGTL